MKTAKNRLVSFSLAFLLSYLTDLGMHTWPCSVDGFPSYAKKSALVTLGKTVADDVTTIERCDFACDVFMRSLMEQLNLKVNPYVFSQALIAEYKFKENGRMDIVLKTEQPQNAVISFEDEGVVKVGEKEYDFCRNSMFWNYEACDICCNEGDVITLILNPKQILRAPQFQISFEIDKSGEKTFKFEKEISV